MDFFTAVTVALILGWAMYFGLNAAGREIRTGLVEAAKVARGDDVVTPDVDG